MTYDEAFARLARSKFRSRFHLSAADFAYIQKKGWPTIERHAADFVRLHLAAAHPPKDGRQTPWHGHPVFIAQHATATCCRGCLNKWWHVPKDVELTPLQQSRIVNLILTWLHRQAACSQWDGTVQSPKNDSIVKDQFL